MFGSVRRKLEQTQAALTAALAERDAYLTQRDIALGERNEFLRQRDAHLLERDQAVHDLDELHAQVSGSSTAMARRFTEGSREGPFGTAHESSTPFHSKRKS